MITVTPQAATQIRAAAVQSNATGLPLRLAIRPKADGSFNYLMGFDEQQAGDVVIQTQGLVVVVAADSQALVKDMTVDFVELEGSMEFIFLNPNDPNYRPPQM